MVPKKKNMYALQTPHVVALPLWCRIYQPLVTLLPGSLLSSIPYSSHTEKKCGAKMAPPWSHFGKRLRFFSLIIMFEKKWCLWPKWYHLPKRYHGGAVFQNFPKKKGWKWYHFSKSGAVLAPLWSCFGSTVYHLIRSGAVLKTDPLSLTLRKKTVPLWRVELKWLHLRMWSHNQPLFGRKRYHFAKWY